MIEAKIEKVLLSKGDSVIMKAVISSIRVTQHQVYELCVAAYFFVFKR